MNDVDQLYRSFTVGFSLITIGACLGGAWTCLAHRRLSYWLIAVAFGLVWASLAMACGLYAGSLAPADPSPVPSIPELVSLIGLLGHVLGLGSSVLVTLGLAASLADVRRKLALSMEPKHART